MNLCKRWTWGYNWRALIHGRGASYCYVGYCGKVLHILWTCCRECRCTLMGKNTLTACIRCTCKNSIIQLYRWMVARISIWRWTNRLGIVYRTNTNKIRISRNNCIWIKCSELTFIYIWFWLTVSHINKITNKCCFNILMTEITGLFSMNWRTKTILALA